MPRSMTGPAATRTIMPVTVTGGDDIIPLDSLLQLETFISAETNARLENAKPNKAGFVVKEGKEVDLATPVSVKSGSKMEVQMTKSVAETVIPVHKVNRLVVENVKRPSWLSKYWKFETKVRTNGASAGAVDIEVGIRFEYILPYVALALQKCQWVRVGFSKSSVFLENLARMQHRNWGVCLPDPPIGLHGYYCEPVSGKKFRSMPEVLRFLKTGSTSKKSTGGDATPSETPNSKKLKKSRLKKEKDKTTSFYSDSLNPPQSVCWVLADSSTDTWAPFVHGNMVPEGQRQEWDAVFSTVSQRIANRDAGVSNVR